MSTARGSGFDDLIEAMTIFKKYGAGSQRPLHCEHDMLYVCDDVSAAAVAKADLVRLEELGFFVGDDDNFMSFRFGSC